MIARPCLGPPGAVRCPYSAVVALGSRCPGCQPAETRRRRNPVYHDPRWRRLSARMLAEHRRTVGPWCPGLPPDHDAHPSFDVTVDHIVPIVDGGAPFDRANARILCRQINSARRS